MNKQDSTFAGKRTDMPENSISAASSAEYLTPEVCVCDFAPENGFALSVRNENLRNGFYKGENLDDEYDITSDMTEDFETYYF